ncbi:Nucleoside-diphosphate-sugar epimerase [Thermomonospora echinospora]|uniref:Nucleoside-diphosphate-sugar epimerase n=1 Tax=Thermomonospora echinospora TaxID=1992 RepID=A0A1H5TRI2_9ACTN|nr:NAD(P)-dependent oxidoreductase [Thermomonospora echinospora]SEF65376.1 Nucleoside-diphosphate-sugar epimerase [Thermomonospora echinospora]
MPARVRPAGGRVAVLGGTGWVGRFICAALAERGQDPLVVARNRVPHVAGYDFRSIDLVTADVGTLAKVLRTEGVDIVINATDGANTNDGWDRTEAELRRANAEAVHRVLGAMAELPWRSRVVHIGTIHEYGPVGVGTPVAESVTPRPVNAYARTKLAGSVATLEAVREGVVDGVVLRLANVCGPHPSPASFPGKLLSLFREAAAGGRVELSIADARRDFVDVRDVADAAVKAAEASVTGRAVNIGSGMAVEIRDLVAHLAEAAGVPPDAVKETGAPVPSLGGDWIQADIRLAARVLRWRPHIGLAESLRAMWETG